MRAGKPEDGRRQGQDDAANANPDDLQDVSDLLFISADGANPSAPWRLQHEDMPALTPPQCEALAQGFGFSVEQIQELSSSLARALDPNVDIHVAPVSRAKAIARSAAALSDVGADLKAVTRRLENARSRLGEVGPSNPYDPIGAVVENLHMSLQRMHDEVSRLLHDVDLLAQHPEMMSLRHDRPSTMPDRRRRSVLLTIKFFLERQDRRLGYTTDPHTSERSGPLVNFVNAVVECVTDPPSTLSPHTIIKDFRSFGTWRTAEEVAADLSAFMEAVRSYRKP